METLTRYKVDKALGVCGDDEEQGFGAMNVFQDKIHCFVDV